MRRALLAELPAFSHYFGIQPWEINQLTFAELDEYRDQLRTLAKRG